MDGELGLPVQVHLQVVASDLRGRQGEFQAQMWERLRARSGNWSRKIENPEEKRLPLVLLCLHELYGWRAMPHTTCLKSHSATRKCDA